VRTINYVQNRICDELLQLVDCVAFAGIYQQELDSSADRVKFKNIVVLQLQLYYAVTSLHIAVLCTACMKKNSNISWSSLCKQQGHC
jgi:hypothetical protein